MHATVFGPMSVFHVQKMPNATLHHFIVEDKLPNLAQFKPMPALTNTKPHNALMPALTITKFHNATST
jgi:hypothetical protein